MAEEQLRDVVIEFPQARLTAGARLRAAREAAGLSLTDMAGQTKIPVRMLTLIEAGNYAALPAKAYATGFTRTYARALGLDEQEMLGEVRRELGLAEPGATRSAPTFEPGDPARVPSARFAWAAAALALVVLAAGLILWRSYYAPAVTLPPLPEASAPAAVAPAPAPVVVAPQPVVPAGDASGVPAAAAPALPAARTSPSPAAVPPMRHAAPAAASPAAAPPAAVPAASAGAAPAPAPAPASTAQF